MGAMKTFAMSRQEPMSDAEIAHYIATNTRWHEETLSHEILSTRTYYIDQLRAKEAMDNRGEVEPDYGKEERDQYFHGDK